jgi:hypothetical protein
LMELTTEFHQLPTEELCGSALLLCSTVSAASSIMKKPGGMDQKTAQKNKK